jgi:hypothetical protein
MKKILLLASAAFLITGLAFAHEGGGKSKKSKAKSSKHCGKGCCDEKAKKTTAKL